MEGMRKVIKLVILGFLMDKELTGYDIKQIMTHSTSNFMNASFGSIYPALDRLEKDDMISALKVIENGKYKKVYTIKDQGKEEFIKWLEEPINYMKSYEEILAKIFFYRHLSKEKVHQLISQLIEDIDKRIVKLERIERDIKGKIDYFEISTLSFGIDHLKFMSKWYSDFLKNFNKRGV